LRRSGVDTLPAFRSDRDEWILAMAAAGLGYALMPAGTAAYPGAVALALTDAAIAREIVLVTLRGRPESAAVGALLREAMRLQLRAAPGPDVAAEAGLLAAGA
jgi:DNA-binding transcriptional LysR family regulator